MVRVPALSLLPSTLSCMGHSDYAQADFAVNPLMFYYEVTMACDLVCKHCRASAQEKPDPNELDTAAARSLLEQAASFPRPPMVVLTGGDPLKRPDLLVLIRHAVDCGLSLALTPSATPLATPEAFQRVREAGIRRLGISLDGADAATHDAFRGWEGSFQVDAIAELLAEHGIAMWAAFFLVPVGRGVDEQRITAEEYEQVFERLYHHSQTKPYAVKTTEAPHYRRYVLQRGGDPLAGPRGEAGSAARRGHRAPLGVIDGRGIMFVAHTGHIYPAGFLPVCCGRFPQDSVVDVYQKHPTFLALRDPDHFKGKCGVCEYRHVCGGSRARAYALTGDPLESDADCAYLPPGFAPPTTT